MPNTAKQTSDDTPFTPKSSNAICAAVETLIHEKQLLYVPGNGVRENAVFVTEEGSQLLKISGAKAEVTWNAQGKSMKDRSISGVKLGEFNHQFDVKSLKTSAENQNQSKTSFTKQRVPYVQGEATQEINQALKNIRTSELFGEVRKSGRYAEPRKPFTAIIASKVGETLNPINFNRDGKSQGGNWQNAEVPYFERTYNTKAKAAVEPANEEQLAHAHELEDVITQTVANNQLRYIPTQGHKKLSVMVNKSGADAFRSIGIPAFKMQGETRKLFSDYTLGSYHYLVDRSKLAAYMAPLAEERSCSLRQVALDAFAGAKELPLNEQTASIKKSENSRG